MTHNYGNDKNRIAIFYKPKYARLNIIINIASGSAEKTLYKVYYVFSALCKYTFYKYIVSSLL